MHQVYVLANDKGGSGKTLLALHLALAWQSYGLKVITLDCDTHQPALSRFFELRSEWLCQAPFSHQHFLWNGENLDDWLNNQSENADVILIDTPSGSHPFLEDVMAKADVLLTPFQQTGLDLEGIMNAQNKASRFSECVWQAKKKRLAIGQKPFDWLWIYNRSFKQNEKIYTVLEKTAQRWQAGLIPGLSYCDVYAQMFWEGKTVLDLETFSLQALLARQELRSLINHISGPDLLPQLTNLAA